MVSHKINTSCMPLTINTFVPLHDKILCGGYTLSQKCTVVYFIL